MGWFSIFWVDWILDTNSFRFAALNMVDPGYSCNCVLGVVFLPKRVFEFFRGRGFPCSKTSFNIKTCGIKSISNSGSTFASVSHSEVHSWPKAMGSLPSWSIQKWNPHESMASLSFEVAFFFNVMALVLFPTSKMAVYHSPVTRKGNEADRYFCKWHII